MESKYKKAISKRFVFKVTEDGIVYPEFETFPSELGRLLNYYIGIYETPKRIEAVIEKIKQHRTRENNNEYLGGNDTTFIVNGELTTFDSKYVSEIPPITIETNEAIEFFERYNQWISRFEKGEIQGLTEPNPNQFRILHDKHDHSKPNRTIKLKGSFFIQANQTLHETVKTINRATNLGLKKNETGFYEEFPAFTNFISGVEYTILGIPEKEYQMDDYTYDNFHFRIQDNSKIESNEWVNEGNRIKELLKKNTNLNFKE